MCNYVLYNLCCCLLFFLCHRCRTPEGQGTPPLLPRSDPGPPLLPEGDTGPFRGRGQGQGCAFIQTTFHMAHSVESFASFVFELCLCVLIWLQEPICGESWEQFVRDWIVTTDYKERTREALCI